MPAPGRQPADQRKRHAGRVVKRRPGEVLADHAQRAACLAACDQHVGEALAEQHRQRRCAPGAEPWPIAKDDVGAPAPGASLRPSPTIAHPALRLPGGHRRELVGRRGIRLDFGDAQPLRQCRGARGRRRTAARAGCRRRAGRRSSRGRRRAVARAARRPPAHHPPGRSTERPRAPRQSARHRHRPRHVGRGASACRRGRRFQALPGSSSTSRQASRGRVAGGGHQAREAGCVESSASAAARPSSAAASPPAPSTRVSPSSRRSRVKVPVLSNTTMSMPASPSSASIRCSSTPRRASRRWRRAAPRARPATARRDR